jgi:hypothetical protein
VPTARSSQRGLSAPLAYVGRHLVQQHAKDEHLGVTDTPRDRAMRRYTIPGPDAGCAVRHTRGAGSASAALPHLSALTYATQEADRGSDGRRAHTKQRKDDRGFEVGSHECATHGIRQWHGEAPRYNTRSDQGGVLCSPVCGFAGEGRKRDGVGRMLFLMAVCCSPCRGERLLIITAIPFGVYGYKRQ